MPTFTTSDLAAHLGGTLEGDGSIEISGLDTVDKASRVELTFVGDERHARLWSESNAGAVVISNGLELPGRDEAFALIRVKSADHAMISLLELFRGEEDRPTPSVHESAIVSEEAVLGADVYIGPSCNVAAGCTIGDRVQLHGGVQVEEGVTIGNDSIIHAGTVIRERCSIGSNTILHANVVIGSQGFGFRPSEDGSKLLGIPHIGSVSIGDDVEIGSCTCVDRGKFGATEIGSGTKIDNLCQVGHNCVIGRMCIVCGHAAIGGSTVIGDGTQIGGGVGIADHVVIGRKVSIGARSGVMNDIPDGEIWYGTPAGERSRILREQVAIRRLPEWSKAIRKLVPQGGADADGQ